MKKLINVWGFSLKEYGSKAIKFKEYISLLLAVGIVLLIINFSIKIEKNSVLIVILRWLRLTMMLFGSFIFSSFFYLKKRNCEKYRMLKICLFKIMLCLFSISILPYTIIFLFSRKIRKETLLEYFYVFMVEIMLLLGIISSLSKVLSEESANNYLIMIFVSIVFFCAYKIVVVLIRMLFIRELYKRCNYINEYNSVLKFTYAIGAFVLSLVSVEFSDFVTTVTAYMLIETLITEIKVRKTQYDLILQIFKELSFLLSEAMPTINPYSNVVIKIKLSINKELINDYVKIYGKWDNSDKKLQKTLEKVADLLNRKFDCTNIGTYEELKWEVINTLNVTSKYLM